MVYPWVVIWLGLILRAAPQFLVRAVKDPVDANLDRVQMVKGWVDAAGEQHEMVYNIDWSGDRQLDADGKLPAVGNTVDLKSARYTNSYWSGRVCG